jgi:calcineurin-like phosphoesterase family protein
MRIFVIADTHFGHTALYEKMCARQADFEDRIKKEWTSVIDEHDLVIHLGDVSFSKHSDWHRHLPSLPGRKVLTIGNHDTKSITWYMRNGFDFCCQSFSWRTLGLDIVFSHEPLTNDNYDLNIHGHLHLGHRDGLYVDDRHHLVALETDGYRPVKLESIVKKWQRRSNP